MKNKLIVIFIVAIMLGTFLTACGNKDVFGFLDVEIGDSKETVKEKYGDDFALNQGNIYAYTNIKKEYESKEQYVSFTFGDEKVDSINATWTLESDEDAKKVFDDIKETAIKQYGDKFETEKNSGSAEYIRWNTESQLINIIRTDDDANGNKVSISIGLN